jgi:hypothetical protein
MRLSSVFFALLIAPLSLPAALAAQTSAGTDPAVLATIPMMHSCPVAFYVARRPAGAIVETGSAQAPRGRGINVSFGKPTRFAKSQAQIVSAEITVHGISPGIRVVPAASNSSRADDVTETFELGDESHPSVWTKQVWTEKMNVVTWVELTKLIYADGASWQPSVAGQCAAAPSSFVLVDSAR